MKDKIEKVKEKCIKKTINKKKNNNKKVSTLN